uniref:UDP-gluconosyltransferase n=1 Tax=Trialeurodes vaporariorum TaxID=88556 RepID=A0A873P536_TRIVP|nr:UDP-gluconosyltransferase [Trialeurodes vaporariorum]
MTFGTLAEELARRGHEVTIVTVRARGKSIPNYREILIDRVTTFGDHFKNYNFSEWRDKIFGFTHLRNTVLPKFLESALETEQMQTLINSQEKFDAVLGEFFFSQQPLLAFGPKFNASLIDLCPAFPQANTIRMVGNPMGISYLPETEVDLTDRMTFSQRLFNTIFSVFKMAHDYAYLLPTSEKVMRRCFRYPGAESLPPINSLMERVSLVLANSHFSNHYPRPYAPNVVEIGGFHIKTPDELPQDLQTFMDEAADGVILVSFGTNIKSHMISEERGKALASFFEGLKARVLWRWDNEGVTKDSTKLLVKKWLPQQSILAHPNCILYLTHGGFSSLTEGIYFGVPFVGVPFFVDQHHNVNFIKAIGIGLKFDIFEETNDDLARAVNTVLNTPTFRENVKAQSQIMRDQPQTPMDRAIFWIEYVIRHKGAHHLKPASVYLPLYQYLLLDVVAFIFIVLALAMIILYRLVVIFFQAAIFLTKVWEQHQRRHYDKPIHEQIYVFIISLPIGILTLTAVTIQNVIAKVIELSKSKKLDKKKL